MDERSGCSQPTCVIKCAFIMQHVSICFKQVLPILTSDLRQIRDGMSELGSWKCLLNAGIFFCGQTQSSDRFVKRERVKVLCFFRVASQSPS